MGAVRISTFTKMAVNRLSLAVRQFSTTCNRSKLVKAPIQLFGIEGRYAHALYSAASKEGSLNLVEKELSGFQSYVDANPALAEFIANPTIKRKEKASVLGDLLKENKVSHITVNFLNEMAENGRLPKMGSIFGAFSTIMSAERGEVVCSVTTAKPLGDEMLEEVKSALNGLVKETETITLSTKIDPAIIGGMQITVGDKYIDMSMASKIKSYTKVITDSVYT